MTIIDWLIVALFLGTLMAIGYAFSRKNKDVEDYFVSRIKRKKWKDIQLKFYSKTRFSLETVTLEAWIGGYIKR